MELNNSVIILTYGFNKNQDDILIHIANQNGTKYGVAANTSVGDVAVIKKKTTFLVFNNTFSEVYSCQIRTKGNAINRRAI